jgi:hypothetical protein
MVIFYMVIFDVVILYMVIFDIVISTCSFFTWSFL